ncbi:MAG TPA: glycosyltransferase [Blastocatellia bacterium]|nr:glycosyltransferase [Blastocatellia bacterium]
MLEAKLSVIIPTYNRKAILKRSLDGYAQQTAREEILEILVVDDGSSDGTGALISAFVKTCPLPVRYLHQTNSGLAAARNHGIRETRGELILLGDDDIIPAPNTVAEHLSWHRNHREPEVGVLGQVVWSPEALSTPFMRWVASGDGYLRYTHLRAGQEVDLLSRYFNNTSLKVEFVRSNGGFDEDFRAYGFEDTEFGYRLGKKGMRLLYNPAATGYHLKRLTFDEDCRRVRQLRITRAIFDAKVGKEVYEQAQRPTPKSTLRYRCKLAIARALVPALFPLKALLDSRVPMPGLVYRAFHHYYAQ